MAKETPTSWNDFCSENPTEFKCLILDVQESFIEQNWNWVVPRKDFRELADMFGPAELVAKEKAIWKQVKDEDGNKWDTIHLRDQLSTHGNHNDDMFGKINFKSRQKSRRALDHQEQVMFVDDTNVSVVGGSISELGKTLEKVKEVNKNPPKKLFPLDVEEFPFEEEET